MLRRQEASLALVPRPILVARGDVNLARGITSWQMPPVEHPRHDLVPVTATFGHHPLAKRPCHVSLNSWPRGWMMGDVVKHEE